MHSEEYLRKLQTLEKRIDEVLEDPDFPYSPEYKLRSALIRLREAVRAEIENPSPPERRSLWERIKHRWKAYRLRKPINMFLKVLKNRSKSP